MSSEAEYERLYQEWVRNGGINPTLTNNGYVQNADGSTTLLGTPATYYNELNDVSLTPEQLAQLQAQQNHYNRTQALQTINNEIVSHNFTNPYNSRADSAISLFSNIISMPAVNDINGISSAFSTLISNLFSGSGSTVLPYGSNMGYTSYNGATNYISIPNQSYFTSSNVMNDFIFKSISDATGINFSNLFLINSMHSQSTSMYGQLQSHTNSQMVNLPDTLDKTSQLADMNQQFGVSSDSCSIFNELMGILSGAFDGVLDFMEAAAGDIISALGQVAGDIANLAGQILGAVAGGLAAVINKIIELIPQPIKDALNAIANAIGAVINAAASLASQIASEAAKFIEMSAELASKLAALALAAAMLDPCKLAVLLNTGSPQLKQAAQQLNAPVSSNAFPVYTENDPRANADDVLSTLNEARNNAQTQPGVPQSPISSSAKLYTPFDPYIHSTQIQVPSIFGTDDKFESTKTSNGTKVTSSPETGSNSKKEITSEIKSSEQARDFDSKAFATWKQNFLGNLLSKSTQASKIKSDVRDMVDNAYFPNNELKDEAKKLGREARNIESKIKTHIQTAQSSMTYTSKTGKRDDVLEAEARDNYVNIYLNSSNSLVERVTRELETIEIRWNSIKVQVIRGPR